MQEISYIKQKPQAQEALNDQLHKLIIVANRLGLYAAADYLKKNLKS